MGEDIHVRSIKLLNSYQRSFNSFSSAVRDSSRSLPYFYFLESKDRLKRAVDGISYYTRDFKHIMSKISWRLEEAASWDTPAPDLVARYLEDLEKCKNAYARAQNYEEQSKKDQKVILAQLDQVKEEIWKLNNKLDSTTISGRCFLTRYIRILQKYSK